MKSIAQSTVKFALVVMMLASASFTFAHNEDPKDPKKVSVVVNEMKPGFATLSWSDYAITTIQINSTNGQVMPAIPVMDATSLHLNGLVNGTYEISFMAGETVVAVETLVINK
jgi:hypothetical protein